MDSTPNFSHGLFQRRSLSTPFFASLFPVLFHRNVRSRLPRQNIPPYRFIRHHRRHVSSSTFPHATASLPSSVGVATDARTGAKLYIIGCVHGSSVSAMDVSTVLTSLSADSVVLELCDSRLRAIKNDMARQNFLNLDLPSQSVAQNTTDSIHEYHRHPYWKFSPIKTFRASCEKFGGVGPALLAMSLTAVYKVQILVGVDPGVEFKTAIAYAHAQGLRTRCGDAKATQTVQRLYRVLWMPLRSAKYARANLKALVERVFRPPKGGICVPRVLLEVARAKELTLLALPLFALASLLTAVTSAWGTSVGVTVRDAGLIGGFPGFPELLLGMGMKLEIVLLLELGKAIAEMMLVVYAILSALHFVKVLIADRDSVLCRAVLKEAERASRRRKSGKPPTIVAVVGMMHVNGILRNCERSNAQYAKRQR